MNYVIIGNSASGIAAIEAIREYDKKSRIIVISEDRHLNYSRPLISYLLAKKIERQQLPFRHQEFYKDNNVELFLGRKATKLDIKRKMVILDNNQKTGFDKLLIATGGLPFVPKIKGDQLKGIFTFTKLDEAEAIEEYIKENRIEEAVVIGGGLIGLKATEALVQLGIKVTVVELADRVLSATFDKKASGVVQGALEKIGCRVIINNTVVEIKGKNNKAAEVILKGRKKIKTSLVIFAIGVKPNLTLVGNTPIKINRGILVNRFMQTNIRDIYAAGDCCEFEEKNQVLAIWPVAVRQGKVAGYNMAGKRMQYSAGLPMNSVELCGLPTISVGETNPEGNDYEILEYFNQDESIYKKIVLQNERIVGIIFVGDIERAGIYTGLIKERVNVAGFKEQLLSKEFGLINLPKDYRKHLVGEGDFII